MDRRHRMYPWNLRETEGICLYHFKISKKESELHALLTCRRSCLILKALKHEKRRDLNSKYKISAESWKWSIWRFGNLVQNLIISYYEKQVKLGSMTTVVKYGCVRLQQLLLPRNTAKFKLSFMNLSKSGFLITWILRHITNSQQGQTLCKVTVLR